VIGDKPTLRHRIQSFIGEVLTMLGMKRLGWDVASYSISGRHICKCGRRSKTEREHLLHHCKEPDWENWGIDA
jgi:hypothetical protein